MNVWLAGNGIEAVCHTFGSDPVASATLLERMLKPLALSKRGYEELPRLARKIKAIIPLGPVFVEDVYHAAFGHIEESDAQTPRGGVVLTLSSNRRQDYQMALHQLAEAFPAFLQQFPLHATRALISATTFYAQKRKYALGEEEGMIEFEFCGTPVSLQQDFSAIWDDDESSHANDDVIKMLNAFMEYLIGLGNEAVDTQTRENIIAMLGGVALPALVWRRLLRAGTAVPETVGIAIRSLLWQVPILTIMDTYHSAGECLRTVFPLLVEHDRERIERTILALPTETRKQQREAALENRDRLLGCLDPVSIVTSKARKTAEALRSAGGAPPNTPPFSFPDDWQDHEHEQQEADADPTRVRPLQLIGRMRGFAHLFRNVLPDSDQIREYLTQAKELYGCLMDVAHSGLRDDEVGHAWGALAEATTVVARSTAPHEDPEVMQITSDILLAAAERTEILPSATSEIALSTLSPWAVEVPRIAAAKGLVALARFSERSESVIECVERLSQDPVPAVRYQITRQVGLLYHSAPDAMWNITFRISREEKNLAVAQGLIGAMRNVGYVEAQRPLEIVESLYKRFGATEGSEGLRGDCVVVVAELYVRNGYALGRDFLVRVADAIGTRPEEVIHVAGHFRQTLAVGPLEPVDPQADMMRKRAIEIVEFFTVQTRRILDQIRQQRNGVRYQDWLTEEKERFAHAMEAGSSIGTEVYFASGAFDEEREGEEEHQKPFDAERKRRFLLETAVILDNLELVADPRLAYHLLKMYKAYISIDPVKVFLRVRKTITEAVELDSFQFDSLAAELVVEITASFLVKYRSLIQDNAELRQALIEVLDIFVKAGWPVAWKLTYRLDELYR